MASQIEALRELAKKHPRTIVLPESLEPRILKAADTLAGLGVAKIVLIGRETDIKKAAAKEALPLHGIRIIDPEEHPRRGEMAEILFELRKHKGLTMEEAKKLILTDPLYFAGFLVRLGEADGFVAGASHATADVARAAIFCIGLDEEIGVMSSSFVVEVENSTYGDNGLFIFGDCGIIPDPTPERLAGIAISCSRLHRDLFSALDRERKPRVALLSYSTKGSAKSASIEKVKKALELIKRSQPDLMVDGELQLDSAIVPEVAKIKVPKSAVAGKANVLIFPNLDAGNIAYKLAQRLAGARVVGPLLEGIKKPASDLSRGCLVEEIIDTVVATAVRAR